jgi:hypothetical protein
MNRRYSRSSSEQRPISYRYLACALLVGAMGCSSGGTSSPVDAQTAREGGIGEARVPQPMDASSVSPASGGGDSALPGFDGATGGSAGADLAAAEASTDGVSAATADAGKASADGAAGARADGADAPTLDMGHIAPIAVDGAATGADRPETMDTAIAPLGGAGGSGATGTGGSSGGTLGTCNGDCSAASLTACTCDVSDPCGWAGDGVCDSKCALLTSTPYDDSADCKGGTPAQPFSIPEEVSRGLGIPDGALVGKWIAGSGATMTSLLATDGITDTVRTSSRGDGELIRFAADGTYQALYAFDVSYIYPCSTSAQEDGQYRVDANSGVLVLAPAQAVSKTCCTYSGKTTCDPVQSYASAPRGYTLYSVIIRPFSVTGDSGQRGVGILFAGPCAEYMSEYVGLTCPKDSVDAIYQPI